MAKKIAVIGEKESVLGFKAVGFEVYEVTSAQSAETIIDRLAQQECGVIFITEQALAPVIHVLERYKDQPTPAIIPIPGRAGPLGLGLRAVKTSVERAVGADILFKDS